MEVLIQPLRKVIEVSPGANLLDALRAAQVPVSYSCMAGRCGTCRCKVLSGEVLDAGRDRQNPLDASDTYVLACQTFLTEPCTIEIPEPDEIVVHPACVVKSTVQSVEPIAHDIKRLVLKPARTFDFSPGQYAELRFTSQLARPYAMAGLGGESTLEFHVRVVPGGRASDHVANDLKPGDTVRVSGPLGTAYLRRRHEGPILCVAGGTGLAPALSIVRGAIAGGMPNPIHIYVAARSPRDVYGLEQVRTLQREHPSLQVHVSVSSGANVGEHHRGLVVDAIERDIDSLAGWQAYLYGSPPMVEATAVLARRMGIEAVRIHAEAFYTQPS
jgi:ferredoxin-NAD(P)+ reductase (naphthalene dioxygenase ferredoxin-specific)